MRGLRTILRRPAALTAHFIRGQMRNDAPALVVALGIVALATFLTASIPPAVNNVVTSQVREIVEHAGSDAQVVVSVPINNVGDSYFEVATNAADFADDMRREIDAGMPPDVATVLGPPVTTIVGHELKAGTIAGQPARVRFAYVASDSGPAMTWIDGRAPAATATASEIRQWDGTPFPVEVGVSEKIAALMGIRAGDKIPVLGPQESDLDVTVSGVYHAEDPTDAAWATVPTLLTPQMGVGAERLTSVALYTSVESLPFALVAMFPDGMNRIYTYPVDAQAITADNVHAVQADARGLASGIQVFDIPGASASVTTRLDTAIGVALRATTAATAQSAVLLVAMVSIALAVELVAAGLLVGSRRTVLARARSRGATAGAVARALAVESGLVVVVGGALGLALAHALVSGDIAWQWVLPPLLVAFVAAPMLGARVAVRRAGSTQAAAVRRIALEAALVVLAAVSMASLVTRGVAASEGSVWADLLVLAAPVLSALAVGVVLVRVLPPLTHWARAAAARAKGVAPLLATARSRVMASAVCALVLVASVIALAATTGATVNRGLSAAADDQVGTDVIARAAINEVLPSAVDDISGNGDVTAALAYVIDGAQLIGTRLDKPATVIAVDSKEFTAMAKDSVTLPRLDALADHAGDAGDALPMLVSAGSADLSGASLHWQGVSVPVKRVGPGVAIPGVAADSLTVVVDRAALAQAIGAPVPATFLWANGVGAEHAVREAIGDSPATITTHDQWLKDQVSSPVAKGLRALFVVTAGMALALGLLAATLIATSGTGDRRRAMGRLRVLGLPHAQAWRIAQWELSIPVFIVTSVGVGVGIVLAAVVGTPLHLSSITGQTGTVHTAVPWWLVLVPPVLTATAWLAVGVAARADRSTNVGQTLRAD